MVKGGLVTPAALAANKWFIDLFRTEKVCPPSAPVDGFVQIIANMESGRHRHAPIHHIGSANELNAALGDDITAVPVPKGPTGDAWATYGDASNAVFSATKNPEAAWKRVSFLSTARTTPPSTRRWPAPGHQFQPENAGTTSPRRFVEASAKSLPLAQVCRPSSATADFTRTVWPQTTQKAMLGQITPDAMMQTFEKLYFG